MADREITELEGDTSLLDKQGGIYSPILNPLIVRVRLI